MAAKKEIEERTNVTGLDQAADRKEAEYDLVTALLEAADFKTSDDSIYEAEIKRGGKFLFSVHLHPLSEADTRVARKKATIYAPNPNGKKLPKIEVDRNEPLFASWLIYLATTEADQEKIWGNPQLMKKVGAMLPVDTIDHVLTIGEKEKLTALVGKISGMVDEDDDAGNDEENGGEETTMDETEYAKN